MMAEFLKLLLLSMACGATSMTLSKSKFFKPLRQFLLGGSRLPRLTRFMGEGLSCPYCTSHWVAIIFMLVYFPRPIHSGLAVADFFIGMMAMVALASITAWVVFAAYSAMSSS